MNIVSEKLSEADPAKVVISVIVTSVAQVHIVDTTVYLAARRLFAIGVTIAYITAFYPGMFSGVTFPLRFRRFWVFIADSSFASLDDITDTSQTKLRIVCNLNGRHALAALRSGVIILTFIAAIHSDRVSTI